MPEILTIAAAVATSDLPLVLRYGAYDELIPILGIPSETTVKVTASRVKEAVKNPIARRRELGRTRPFATMVVNGTGLASGGGGE